MKRLWVSALLPLWAWAGCESNEPPNTSGNCRGLVTINLEVPGGINSAKAIASTMIGPEGVRYEQVDKPPLPVPNVVLREKELYRTGNQWIRVVAADSDPGKGTASAPASVAAVGRAAPNFSAACPSIALSLTATRLLDVCFDRCDSEVRCGTRPQSGLEACQDDCRAHEAEFSQQQADWTAQYQNATDLVRQLEGCNFVACNAIEACGEGVMAGAVAKP